jgi:glutamate-ammonia-ligase adenylyltransferase
MGYDDTPDERAADRFLADYRLHAQLNRTILNHLLHDAFPEDGKASVEPEVDLVLDPYPEPETVHRVLGRYHFRDVDQAYKNLMLLARESIPFLSTPRCRHFLASIAPRLLQAISQTPDPDLALVNLANVSESLGGKAVLWELFSFNPPSLKLYVDLCAGSQFLVDMLISNPGMIDELMDSLVLNQPRELAELQSELHDLCRGAEDPKPTLQGFKNTEILRVGVRDILGKNDLLETFRSLSHIAEAILNEIAVFETEKLRARWGRPLIADGPRQGEEARMAIVVLGKLGGRELNFHSDLDVIFLYEADGTTAPSLAGTLGTSNMHFFSELAQRIIRTATETGPHGRLYEVDPRLRPAGRSGNIALPIAEFSRYYASGEGQLWERQALTRARVMYGDPDFAEQVAEAIHAAAFGPPWKDACTQEIVAMRKRLEASGSERDLKRGPGGIVDIEFLAQALQLRYGGANPRVRHTNTLEALHQLHAEGFLTAHQTGELQACYRFFSAVTKQLRLLYNTSRVRLPELPEELDKLAHHLGYASHPGPTPAERFLQDCSSIVVRTRALFDEIMGGG